MLLPRQPNHPGFQFNLATALKFIGDFEGARLALKTVTVLAPEHADAHYSLSSIAPDPAHLPTLQQQLKSAKTGDARLALNHALAREYEQLGNHEQAFACLEAGKSAKLAEIEYDVADDLQLFEALAQPVAWRTQGHESQEPIFVVGMPRTGTTLVERILSNHQDVSSTGELQHFAKLFQVAGW